MKNAMMVTRFNLMDVIIANFNVLQIVQNVLKVNVYNVLQKNNK